MLHHFHVEDDVIVAAFGGQFLGGDGAIVDGQTGLGGMGLGRADIALRGICPCDGEAEPRHGLRQQASAAADIQQRQSIERAQGTRVAAEMGGHLALEERQPHRIEFVQRGKLARGIPPLRCDGGELGDFGGVYRRAWRSGACHA